MVMNYESVTGESEDLKSPKQEEKELSTLIQSTTPILT